MNENMTIAKMLALIPKLPPTARSHLIVYVKKGTYNLYHRGQKEQTKASLDHIKTIINYLQPGLKMNSRLIRAKLWLLILQLKFKAF